MGNYWPISLTNVDYKILAYVLVRCLKTCVDGLIHHFQTAYLPGKFMGTNVWQVQDVISDIHKHQSSQVVFFLDF